MAIARVVSFDGVDMERIAQLKSEMEGEPPEEIDASEMVVLHDADGEKAIAILFFDSDEAYRKADAFLDAMPAGDTPGRRTAVERYDVPIHLTR
jgi:hypothetical protein